MCTHIILIDIDDLTSFKTNNLFENFDNDDERENIIYSDCDDSIKDPDCVPPYQTLEISNCTGQYSYKGKLVSLI